MRSVPAREQWVGSKQAMEALECQMTAVWEPGPGVGTQDIGLPGQVHDSVILEFQKNSRSSFLVFKYVPNIVCDRLILKIIYLSEIYILDTPKSRYPIFFAKSGNPAGNVIF